MGGDNHSDAYETFKHAVGHSNQTTTKAEQTAADFIGSSSKPISILPAYEKRQPQKLLEQQIVAARPNHKTAHSFRNSRRFR